MSQKNMFLIFVFILFLVTFCACINTISFNQSLSNGDLLVSSGKKFALGFFSAGNSNKRYVGIWYNNVPEQTLVWVANRDNPITSNSGVFTINPTGNLVILDRKKNILAWQTNISSRGRGISYSAQLLDSGNFVLFQDLKREVIIWQSFDYPTNTILPDMKFGIDKKAGLNRSLTSWKSMDDPGSGGYVYKLEIHGMPQNFLYKDSNRIWSTGAWTGLGWSGVPEMKPGYIFTIDYVDNVSEASVTFRMLDSSVISRLVLNESGMMTILNWQENKWVQFWSAPKDRCDNYEHCGTFSNCNLYRLGEFECSCLLGYEPRDNRSWYLRDGSHGCMRKKDEKVCKNGEGFAKLTNVKVPDTYTAQLNMSMGLQECEQLCLNNCSCTAYASANVSVGGIGCITWYGHLIDTREFTDGGQDFYIRVSATQLAQFLENPNGDHSKRTIAIVVVCVSAILITVLFACFLVIRKRRKDNQEEQFTSLNTLKWNLSSYEDSTRGNEMDGSEHVDVLIFELSTMISATDDFSDANKLGEGGFGSVYKGLLNNAQEIAVKRLSKNSGQGVLEFKNEVTLIARVQHRNLVRLLGCCIQRGEKMLVYEYLPNKGLDNFIFDKTKGPQLDWRKRYEIIVGIARGLSYLHHDSRVRIIHRDLKASNVLLDASMHPKISDFGTARIFGGDQIEANTNRVVGTYGYMAPEYAMEGHFSVKSDVFSFGVLLLEIITGRKNTTHFQDQSLNLVGYVWDFWSNEKALDVVDPLLGDSYEADEILRCIQIGLLCVQSFANDRPLMSEVVFMLCNETKLSNPGQPGFLIRSGNFPSLPYSSSASVGTSVNDITITAHQAR